MLFYFAFFGSFLSPENVSRLRALIYCDVCNLKIFPRISVTFSETTEKDARTLRRLGWNVKRRRGGVLYLAVLHPRSRAFDADLGRLMNCARAKPTTVQHHCKKKKKKTRKQGCFNKCITAFKSLLDIYFAVDKLTLIGRQRLD